MPEVKFQRRFELAPKVINSKTPEKAKRNPWEEISRDYHSQGRSDLAPKGNTFWGASRTMSPKWKILRIVQFLRRYKLSPKKKFRNASRRILHQCDNVYVVYEFYLYLNFAPAGQFIGSVQFLRRSKFVPKKIILRSQRDVFVPTELEIQIWVWDFGCKVKYTKIRRNGFSLWSAKFFFLKDDVEIRRKCCD